jgi:hypothetical protein
MGLSACLRNRLADSAALRLARRLRFRGRPPLALTGIHAFAGIARCFAGARSLAGVDAHAMDSLRRLLCGSRRHGDAIQCERNRRHGETCAGNNIDLHVYLLRIRSPDERM